MAFKVHTHSPTMQGKKPQKKKKTKQKKHRIVIYSWLHTGTNHKNLAIWKPFFFRNLAMLFP
jgi:hypothetical protein